MRFDGRDGVEVLAVFISTATEQLSEATCRLHTGRVSERVYQEGQTFLLVKAGRLLLAINVTT
jgi:hypothetical protein